MKHTPGPWIIRQTEYVDRFIFVSPQWWNVEADNRVEFLHGRSLANVRLMSAAPDLLEACKELLATSYSAPVNGQVHTHDAAIKMRAAISKAEGKS